MLVVFLHGWGVRNPDYGALPEWLRERMGANVVDVWLSDYISYSDSVTMGDLVDAFERARRQNFPDMKFACVTHSTGGPLARQWLTTYGSAGAAEGLLTHLVMLAPPHHGSALAQLGKGRLSRMALWFDHREPGEQILNWLELGSLEGWRLNLEALELPRSVFLFSLIGSAVDQKLYDHLNSYTGEKGSDGVVRAAAANLNYSRIELKQAGPELQVIGKQRSAPSAFGILPRLSHSGSRMGILSSITSKNVSHHLAALWVERCLSVTTPEGYTQVSGELAASLEGAPEQGCMIVVRVKDGAGRPVKDFDLYLTGGPDYNPGHLPKNFFIDRQRNQLTPNALTYYVDHRVFRQAKELGLRIGARPQSGPVNYLSAEFRSEEATVAGVLGAQETVMVDITLERRLDQAVFQLRRAA
jgi:pimeloyl-ACP methyl ester carboxylesterase